MRRYRIEVRGECGELVSTALSGVTIETEGGRSVITADVAEGADLYRLLARLRDFGLEFTTLRELGGADSDPLPIPPG